MLVLCTLVALVLPCFGHRLEFRAGQFKIVQFTDLHLGEHARKDANTMKVVHEVLRLESDVNLVILSGDMVSGFMNRYSMRGWFEQRYTPLLRALAEHNVVHAMVLGNHDDEGMLSRTDIVRLDQASNSSLTQLGPAGISGATNYFLDVWADSTVAARLWFLDSMDRGCAGVPGWGCVRPDTVDWFKRTAAEQQAASTSLAFIHIPLPEFVPAWNHGQVWGTKGEAVCCPSCNSGTFEALKSVGISAIYSGHDHDNDYLALWKGVRLAYGRKSGYGSYGPSMGPRGARVIVLRAGDDASASETYFRLEDGTQYVQQRTYSPLWHKLQWSCEPGMTVRSMMFGSSTIKHAPTFNVTTDLYGGCYVSSAPQ